MTTTGAPNTSESRQEAMKDLERETDEARRLGREFSGQRLKAMAKPEWFTKAAFVLGTAVAVFFVFAHGGKEERARKEEARGLAQADEPSVRDFRPPVMPVRVASPAPVPIAESAKSFEKPAGKSTEDPEAASKQRKAAQLEEARTKSDLLVKGGASGAASTSSANPALSTAFATAESGMPALGGANRPAGPTEGPADPNRGFAAQVSGKPVVTAYPKAVGNLECLALQGKLIDAELETAINTDLPGQIRADRY